MYTKSEVSKKEIEYIYQYRTVELVLQALGSKKDTKRTYHLYKIQNGNSEAMQSSQSTLEIFENSSSSVKYEIGYEIKGKLFIHFFKLLLLLQSHHNISS